MRLVYTKDQETYPQGQEVKVGDMVQSKKDPQVFHKVTYFRPPHKPSSEGKISVDVYARNENAYGMEYYVGVIGAEWIEREDRV